MKNNRKGSALPYLIILLIIVVLVVWLVLRLDWRKFKAEASFTFTMIAIVVIIILAVFLFVRHKIVKAKKAKALEKAERVRREQELKEAGLLSESSLGNGIFDASDVTELAGKVGDKISNVFGSDDADTGE